MKPKTGAGLMLNFFSSIFLLSRQWETIFDRESPGPRGMSAKQWLVFNAIQTGRSGPPSLKQVARLVNASHQNTKALCLQLEKKGHIVMKKDETDKRVLRLEPTAAGLRYLKSRAVKYKSLIKKAFLKNTGSCGPKKNDA